MDPVKNFNTLREYLEKGQNQGLYNFVESSNILNALNNLGQFLEQAIQKLNETQSVQKSPDFERLKINLMSKNIEMDNLKKAYNKKIEENDELTNKVSQLKNILRENNIIVSEAPQVNVSERTVI